MRPSTILLVDRDSDSVAIYSMMLRHHGFDVLHAAEPEEALTLLRETQPDVIISALSRPRRDGTAFIERVRQDERVANTPLIILDSVRLLGENPAGRGSITRLTKPCEPSRLLNEVRRVLSDPTQIAT